MNPRAADIPRHYRRENPMRPLIKDFVRILSETLPIVEPVYEFGALQVPGQEGFADLRPFFAGREYVGCDLQSGPGVDKIIDLHDISLDSGSVGTALILDTIEHVEYPRKAMDEIHRVLKPDGMVAISSVMNFKIHNFPYDYWRFSPEAFRSLLKPFPKSLADFAGEEEFPHTVVGLGLKDAAVPLEGFIAELREWKKSWGFPREKLWRKSLKLFLPPVLVDLYRKIKYS